MMMLCQRSERSSYFLLLNGKIINLIDLDIILTKYVFYCLRCVYSIEDNDFSFLCGFFQKSLFMQLRWSCRGYIVIEIRYLFLKKKKRLDICKMYSNAQVNNEFIIVMHVLNAYLTLFMFYLYEFKMRQILDMDPKLVKTINLFQNKKLSFYFKPRPNCQRLNVTHVYHNVNLLQFYTLCEQDMPIKCIGEFLFFFLIKNT